MTPTRITNARKNARAVIVVEDLVGDEGVQDGATEAIGRHGLCGVNVTSSDDMTFDFIADTDEDDECFH